MGFRWTAPKPLSAAGRPASSLGLSQACLFFLMGFLKQRWALWTAPKPFSAAGRPASNVRPFGPPPNPSRQLAGLPLQRQAFWTALKPFSAAGRPASSLGLSQACLLSSYGLPKATLGIVDRPQTLLGGQPATLGIVDRGPPPNPSRQLAGLPLLFACPRPASSLLMGVRKQR